MKVYLNTEADGLIVETPLKKRVITPGYYLSDTPCETFKSLTYKQFKEFTEIAHMLHDVGKTYAAELVLNSLWSFDVEMTNNDNRFNIICNQKPDKITVEAYSNVETGEDYLFDALHFRAVYMYPEEFVSLIKGAIRLGGFNESTSISDISKNNGDEAVAVKVWIARRLHSEGAKIGQIAKVLGKDHSTINHYINKYKPSSAYEKIIRGENAIKRLTL